MEKQQTVNSKQQSAEAEDKNETLSNGNDSTFKHLFGSLLFTVC
jgi:hypothetical protein